MTEARRPVAIIADDEPRLAEYLQQRLAVLWPDLVVAGLAQNGPQASALIAAEAPDVAFLDIRMPGLSGLDVARTAGAVHVVFVTAYDQYAVDAFEREALDYLLKPVTDERLAQTVERIRQRLGRDAPAPGLHAALAALAEAVPGLRLPAAERLAWVRASLGNDVRLIPVEDVCYFESNDKYTSVFTTDAEALIRTPLKELIAQLDPERFWQVHRGTVVNVAHVERASRDLAGRVTLKLKTRREPLRVSRAFAHRFKQM